MKVVEKDTQFIRESILKLGESIFKLLNRNSMKYARYKSRNLGKSHLQRNTKECCGIAEVVRLT